MGNPLENPAIPLDQAYSILVDAGGISTAGTRVNEWRALGVGIVHQAVDRISGDIAKLPLHVEQRGEQGVYEPQPQHRVTRLVDQIANDELHLTAYKFWRQMMAQVLVYGHGFALIERDQLGFPRALIPLLPGVTSVQIDPANANRRWLYTQLHLDGQLLGVAINLYDVLWIEGLCWDGMTAPPLVQTAREAVGLALADMGYQSAFYQRGGRTAGYLEIPAMPKPVVDRLLEGFRAQYEGQAGWFKTIPLFDGVKWREGNMTPEQSQLVESRRELQRDVLRWFNLRPSLLGLDQAGGYNSKLDDTRDYYDTTLLPWLRQIQSECELKLLPRSGYTSGRYRLRHNIDELHREQRSVRYQAHQVGLQGMFLTRNEVRRIEGLPPVEGGDEFVNPNTTTDRGPADDSGPGEPNQPPQEQESSQQLVASAVQRLLEPVHAKAAAAVRRGSGAFIEWLDEQLPEQLQHAAEQLQAYVAVCGHQELCYGLLAAVREDYHQVAATATAEQLGRQVAYVRTKHETDHSLQFGAGRALPRRTAANLSN